jgi:hypothetical protein
MPSTPNWIALSRNPVFKEAVKCELVRFSSEVLNQETPIISPNAGYKMYLKRMDFAARAVANPELYAEQVGRLVALCQPDVELNDWNGQTPQDWMTSNNTGQSVMTFEALRFNQSPVANTSGRQIFDNVAGVNQEDLL